MDGWTITPIHRAEQFRTHLYACGEMMHCKFSQHIADLKCVKSWGTRHAAQSFIVKLSFKINFKKRVPLHENGTELGKKQNGIW